MDPEDLLTLNALITARRASADPQPQGQTAPLADALRAYATGQFRASRPQNPELLADTLRAYMQGRGESGPTGQLLPPDNADRLDASGPAPSFLSTMSGERGVTADQSLAQATGQTRSLQAFPSSNTSSVPSREVVGPAATGVPSGRIPLIGAIGGYDPNALDLSTGSLPEQRPGDAPQRVSDLRAIPVSYQMASRGSGPTARSGAPGAPRQLDPSRTEVFQPGPDGKLHPVPGWRTTGPFDFGDWSHEFNWGGVGRDLGEIATGAAFSSDLGALLGTPELLSSLGLDDLFVGKGAKGFIDAHHADPMFMGGRPAQDKIELIRRFHHMFHQRLGAALRQAGFPPVGGRIGKATIWAERLRDPAEEAKAIAVLRQVSRDFDIERGTSILPALEKELGIGRPGLAGPARVPPKPLPQGVAPPRG